MFIFPISKLHTHKLKLTLKIIQFLSIYLHKLNLFESCNLSINSYHDIAFKYSFSISKDSAISYKISILGEIYSKHL